MSEKVCYCGAPVPKGRSKYCSEACMKRIYNGSFQLDNEDEAAGDDLPAPPENAVGAWMTPKELRKRNRELRKLGKRICRTHQGAALPLDEQHFYYASRQEMRFDTECKCCHRRRQVRNQYERYHSDPEFRRRLIDRHVSRRKHLRTVNPVVRERENAQTRRRYYVNKRQQLARVLGVAS